LVREPSIVSQQIPSVENIDSLSDYKEVLEEQNLNQCSKSNIEQVHEYTNDLQQQIVPELGNARPQEVINDILVQHHENSEARQESESSTLKTIQLFEDVNPEDILQNEMMSRYFRSDLDQSGSPGAFIPIVINRIEALDSASSPEQAEQVQQISFDQSIIDMVNEKISKLKSSDSNSAKKTAFMTPVIYQVVNGTVEKMKKESTPTMNRNDENSSEPVVIRIVNGTVVTSSATEDSTNEEASPSDSEVTIEFGDGKLSIDGNPVLIPDTIDQESISVGNFPQISLMSDTEEEISTKLLGFVTEFQSQFENITESNNGTSDANDFESFGNETFFDNDMNEMIINNDFSDSTDSGNIFDLTNEAPIHSEGKSGNNNMKFINLINWFGF